MAWRRWPVRRRPASCSPGLNGADVLAIDAATYFAFAALLGRSQPPARQRHTDPTPTTAADANLEAAVETKADRGMGVLRALRFVVGQPTIIATTVMFMLFNVGYGIIPVLLPVYAQTVLAGGGASGYGLLSSALAAGELQARRPPHGHSTLAARPCHCAVAVRGRRVPPRAGRTASAARRGGIPGAVVVLHRPAHGLAADAADAADPRPSPRPRLWAAADQHAGSATARRPGRIRPALRPRPAPGGTRNGPADRRARRCPRCTASCTPRARSERRRQGTPPTHQAGAAGRPTEPGLVVGHRAPRGALEPCGGERTPPGARPSEPPSGSPSAPPGRAGTWVFTREDGRCQGPGRSAGGHGRSWAGRPGPRGHRRPGG